MAKKRIRVLRTNNLANISQSDDLNFVPEKGQPFYDAESKMLFIGDGASKISDIKADYTKSINSDGAQRLINVNNTTGEVTNQSTTEGKLMYIDSDGKASNYNVNGVAGKNIGSTTNPVYVANDGTVTASNANVGSSIQPTYLNDGTITKLPKTISETIIPQADMAEVFDKWVKSNHGQGGIISHQVWKQYMDNLYLNSSYGQLMQDNTNNKLYINPLNSIDYKYNIPIVANGVDSVKYLIASGDYTDLIDNSASNYTIETYKNSKYIYCPTAAGYGLTFNPLPIELNENDIIEIEFIMSRTDTTVTDNPITRSSQIYTLRMFYGNNMNFVSDIQYHFGTGATTIITISEWEAKIYNDRLVIYPYSGKPRSIVFKADGTFNWSNYLLEGPFYIRNIYIIKR